MAALSFNVHSATTFALISFIYNINALRGFFMCGFFFSSSFLESWCFLKSKDTTDRDLTVRTPCEFIKLIPSISLSINPQQSLGRGPEGSLEPSPWLLCGNRLKSITRKLTSCLCNITKYPLSPYKNLGKTWAPEKWAHRESLSMTVLEIIAPHYQWALVSRDLNLIPALCSFKEAIYA